MPRSVNKLTLLGHVGQDPEVREVSTANGTRKVANFSIATSPPWDEEKTEWHRCVVWGKAAGIVEQYVSKGDMIYVEGRLQYDKWQDDAGQDRTTAQMNVDDFTLLGRRSSPLSNERPQSSGTDSPSEDDLPF